MSITCFDGFVITHENPLEEARLKGLYEKGWIRILKEHIKKDLKIQKEIKAMREDFIKGYGVITELKNIDEENRKLL